jgi:dihydroorotase
VRLTKDVIVSGNKYESLPKRILLHGGRVLDISNNVDGQFNVVIENGKIEEVGKISPDGFKGETLDCSRRTISPGWLDMHVHLREPGNEGKETIATGSLAAANGGFTGVCCMPNTNPPVDSQEMIQYIKDRSKGALVNVYPIATISKRREGKELSEILELVEQGAVGISDDGSPVMSAELMRRALEYSKMVDVPVIGHEEDITMTDDRHIHEGLVSTCLGLKAMPSVAEELMIARDIMLAEYTGGRFHVAHLSTKKGVELVREAKKKGLSVTAEATPHHFTLTDESVRSFDTNTKMNPPLRTEEDRLALLEGVKDGTIDVIASDHAPHSFEEKEQEYIYAPFGIVGLETSLGLSLTRLVHSGLISLKTLVTLFAVKPYQILNLPQPGVVKGKLANLTIFSEQESWTVDRKRFLSKSANSPFLGWEMQGKPFAVINNNQIFKSVL